MGATGSQTQLGSLKARPDHPHTQVGEAVGPLLLQALGRDCVSLARRPPEGWGGEAPQSGRADSHLLATPGDTPPLQAAQFQFLEIFHFGPPLGISDLSRPASWQQRKRGPWEATRGTVRCLGSARCECVTKGRPIPTCLRTPHPGTPRIKVAQPTLT